MSRLLEFPHPVNEKAARTVAAGVAVISLLTVVTGQLWLTAVLAYGFAARVATGPTLSPLGQLATRVIAPQLGRPKLVAGPPKRFAQGIGAALSISAAVLYFGFGAVTAPLVLVGLIAIAAALESVFALCIGCVLFGLLMRLHVIPDSVCADCADITGRLAGAR